MNFLFFSAWREIYGFAFNDSQPWSCNDPKRRVPAVCTRMKTYMLSHGCTSTDADRVLKYFKKWYKDLFDK